jgi:signal transduction histidine kinase
MPIRVKVTGIVLLLLFLFAFVVILEVRSATGFLLLLVGCAAPIAILAAWLLTSVVIKPIHDLAKATDAITRGDFRQRVPVRSGDEVGRLGASFNAMAEALDRSRSEIEEVNRQLVQRNAELSVTTAIATALSGSLELEHILDDALGTVLELLRFSAGWVFLEDSENGCLSLAASRGFSDAPLREQVGNAPENCNCRRTMDTSQAYVVDDIPACLQSRRAAIERDGVSRHVGIPLKAREKAMGVMGVGCSRDRPITDGDVHLLTSIGRQIGMAIENARLVEELRHKDDLQQRLLDKLIRAHEDERTRVARELHDGAGQSLTALLMQLGNLEETLPADADRARQHVADIEGMAAAVVEEIRRLMIDLRPALLDDLGLIPAISSYADAQLARAGVKFHVEVEGVQRKLAPSAEIALFRIIQEAITNTAKHAAARKVRIRLRFKELSVEVMIEDDGRGFDPVRSRTNWNALGLLGVEERVALLGGSLRIDSWKGYGTRIALEIPAPSG